MGQLDVYTEEIFNFLKTVTIKFQPFAESMGAALMKSEGYTNCDDTWNPYYKNICGEYASTDTLMTVYSVEEEKHVPFDKNLKINYPKTAAVYKVGTTEYTTLMERYPNNIGLIQSIVYPVSDIDTAISADNLSLLAYDDSYLDYNERDSLVSYLKDFLKMVRVRWWVPEYAYENMYASTFWAMLWQHLPALLLAKRFQNIKTPQVHTYHIWEYLLSKGLGDYRDVLTNNQSLWLYRNIDYILKNKGKQSNLIILAENLLEEIFVTLLYKDMYQETATKSDQCLSNPEFRSFNIVTAEEVMVESFSTLNNRLVELGIETESGIDYETATEQTLATHNFNVLQTKFLEFKKESMDTSTETLMINHFLDTLFYRISINRCSFNCSFTDPLTGTTMKMDINDMVLLWNWSILRALDETPVVIPTSYVSTHAFIGETPTVSDLKQDLYMGGSKWSNTELVDLETIVTSLPWNPISYAVQEDFVDFLVGQLRFVKKMNTHWDQSNKYMYHHAVVELYKKIKVNKKVTLDLSSYDSYAGWLASIPELENIIKQYEELEDPSSFYTSLSETCFDAVFPVDDSDLDEFLGSVRNMDKVYASVRNLFIQLCSYNVTYLETDRDLKEYVKIAPPDFVDFFKTEFDLSSLMNRVVPNLSFSLTSHEDINIPAIDIATGLVIGDMSSSFYDELDVGIDFEASYDWHWATSMRIDPKMDLKSSELVMKKTIYTDNTNIIFTIKE